MLHDIRVAGFAYGLRPVNDDDAAFIVELRSNPALNRFLHSGAGDERAQRAWLKTYYERPGDYYFVVESQKDGGSVGVISIYDLNAEREDAEWGRWILKPESLAAVESAYLMYRVAFERLNLQSVYCRTVRKNEQVVSFHDSCELSTRTVLPRHFHLAEGAADAIEHRLLKNDSERVLGRLEKLAQLTARMVARD